MQNEAEDRLKISYKRMLYPTGGEASASFLRDLFRTALFATRLLITVIFRKALKSSASCVIDPWRGGYRSEDRRMNRELRRKRVGKKP